MAKKSLRSQLGGIAKSCGGSHLTKAARATTMRSFSDHLKQAFNGNIRDVAQIRTHHIESYATAMQGKVSARTLANRLSHIRTVMESAGKGKMLEQDRLSNSALGAAGGSRIGAKVAMPDADYVHFHAEVSAKSAAAGVVMELQRALGLRVNEAVQGANQDTLQQWHKQLQQGYVNVTQGTKGGRQRETLVNGYQRALNAVSAALVAATANGGYVIAASDGKQAYHHMTNTYRSVGMVGDHASHSLRYAWAQEQKAAYLAQGISESHARKELSQDLGHGDGRGRYVAMVYCRKNG